MLNRPKTPLDKPVSIESLEDRQLFAAGVPMDLPHMPAFLGQASERVQMFGIVLSMARSFPSNLVTRIDPQAMASQAERASADEPTSPPPTAQALGDALPAGQAQRSPSSSHDDAATTIDPSRLEDVTDIQSTPADGTTTTTNRAEPVVRADRPIPVVSAIAKPATIPVQVSHAVAQPFSSIPIALTGDAANADQASRLRELAQFNNTSRPTETPAPEAETKASQSADQTFVADALPLASIPTDAIQLTTFWRNLLAGATLVLTTIAGWHLRRTSKRRRSTSPASMSVISRR